MKNWGFDTTHMDLGVRPQDDFYAYANGGWLKTATIPKDEARWGSFVTLRYDTEIRLKKIVETTRDQQVRDLYRSAMDMGLRNKLGTAPLQPFLAKVRAVKSKEQFLDTLAYLHVRGVSGLWGAFVDQDSKISTQYILHLWQGGLGMPERDYYLLDAPEQKRVRDAYKVHIAKLMRLAGATKVGAESTVRVVMDIETKLAQASMKREDTRDAEKTYHKKSLAQLQKLSPTVNWHKYFTDTNATKARQIIVGQPEFFTFVSKLIKTTPLEDLKTYMEWHVINGLSSLLSEPFVKQTFAFYGTVLSGTKQMKPLWRRALAATNGALGFKVGKLYVQKHFPPAAKRAMDTLVSDLFAVYADRIRALSWMSPATNRKAVQKLRLMRRKIGYPTKWKSYKGLVVKRGDFFGTMLRSEVHEHRYQMNKLGRPIDRTEWFMPPQIVNAYHASSLNEIVFPAAILQWPFFDLKADDAINYAGIGSVIGHEMTHGFDDQGAKFDGRGNMRQWWATSDKKRFEVKAKHFVKQAGAYDVAPGIKLNGMLTLGENIADHGGLVIAYDAYQKHLKKTGRKEIDGLSPEQRFFLGFAQMERELVRDEFKKMQALTDPHAVAPWRINGPLSNFEPFYKTFGVTKKNKLYRAPKTRADIW